MAVEGICGTLIPPHNGRVDGAGVVGYCAAGNIETTLLLSF